MSDSERARCSAHTHFWVSENRRYVSSRCTDNRCPQALYAKSTGQIAIHIWDLMAEWGDDYEPRTEFEMQVRRKTDEDR